MSNQCMKYTKQFAINRWLYDGNSIYDADDMNEWGEWMNTVIYESIDIIYDFRGSLFNHSKLTASFQAQNRCLQKLSKRETICT